MTHGGDAMMDGKCSCEPDDPCFCFPERLHPEPRIKIRYSARFVEQFRDLSGDHRFPLRPVPQSLDGVRQ